MESSITPRSRTVDDGRMADPANVTWSLLSWCCRRRVAHHMKSVFAGFNFKLLDTIYCAMSSMQSVRRSSTSRASCCLAERTCTAVCLQHNIIQRYGPQQAVSRTSCPVRGEGFFCSKSRVSSRKNLASSHVSGNHHSSSSSSFRFKSPLNVY